jgi:hypothetical protein
MSISFSPCFAGSVTRCTSRSSLGETFYVGGSGPGNYSTIQAAINCADKGDIVFVFSGVYYEHITVNKSISLLGEERNSTILYGNGSGDLVSLTADDILFQSFTVNNSHFGIVIHGTSGHCIYNTNIVNNLHGISLQKESTSIEICHNFFDLNQYGIRMNSCSQINMHHNQLESYKLNAFFVGTCFAHAKNTWDANYWERHRIMPYPIFGKISLGAFSLPWLNFDWHPLSS